MTMTLPDLLRPIDVATFYRDHWLTSVPFLSQPNDELVRAVRASGVLASMDALLACYTRDVGVFGPGPARRSAPASAAREALDAGRNVYFPRVSEVVPEVASLFRAIAAELGLGARVMNVEAFAGTAGGVSSRHFDHEVNFQILLDGEKEWEFEPNLDIANPLRPFHPTRDSAGEWVGFSEEGYAADLAMPMAFDPHRSYRLHASAGSVLFIPRGIWHEARSIAPTWGINLAFKGLTRADALARALADKLHEDPRFRAYCDGYRGRTLGEEHERDRARTFAALKDEAARALSSLSVLDADLSPMGNQRCTWVDDASTRALARRDDGWELHVPPLLDAPLALPRGHERIAEALCAFRHPFLLKHARAAMPDVDPETIYNLVALLARKKLLEVRTAHETT